MFFKIRNIQTEKLKLIIMATFFKRKHLKLYFLERNKKFCFNFKIKIKIQNRIQQTRSKIQFII